MGTPVCLGLFTQRTRFRAAGWKRTETKQTQKNPKQNKQCPRRDKPTDKRDVLAVWYLLATIRVGAVD